MHPGDNTERLAPRLEPGTKVGPYEIRSVLGSGGMGTVYRARDTRLERDVALKFLSGLYSKDHDELDRFRREARAISALNHPNVCTIYDIGEDAGRPFLIMELLEGQTLKQRLSGPRLSSEEIVSIGLQISDALDAAHAKGIIHRDIKPANLFLTTKGVVKILDFGIAKATSSRLHDPRTDPDLEITAQETLTKAGVALGTVSYFSPEQAAGKEVDARSDLFSLGVVLYEMATGILPFSGENWMAIVNAVSTRTPRPARELATTLEPELNRIIEKALEKDRGTRYQTAGDMHADFLRVHRGIAQPPLHDAPSAKRKWLPIGAGLLMMGVLVFAGIRYLPPSDPPVPSPADYVQITNFPDSAMWPSLSPDGRMVTFLRGGGPFPTRGEIYVKLLPNGEAVRLVGGDALRFGPVFTPEGTRIAYSEVQHTPSGPSWDTWVIPVLGGAPSRLLVNASGLVWLNPKEILFSEITTGLHMGIVTATETRTGHRVIYFPDHERAMAHFSYRSPDGQSVLIVEMDRTATFLPCRLIPFDGSSAGRQVGPTGQCTSAAWSPDGEWIYLGVEVDGRSHLWRQRFPDGKPQQLTFGPTEEHGIAVAPDGRSLITSVGTRLSTLWIHDAAGERPVTAEGIAIRPNLSRDGKRLYYLLRQQADTVAQELRLLDLNSGNNESLLPGFSIADYDISHDERSAVFTTKQQGQEPQIWLSALDRRSPPRVIAKGGDEVSFGAEGEIYFRELSAKANYLSRLHIEDGHRERVAESPILNKLSVSADGQWAFAFVQMSGHEPGTETIAIPTHGGAVRKICTFLCVPRWSKDLKSLYITLRSQSETVVFPVRPEMLIPDLPPTGVDGDSGSLAGVRVIKQSNIEPGRDPSTYVFTNEQVLRNLFRIPLD